MLRLLPAWPWRRQLLGLVPAAQCGCGWRTCGFTLRRELLGGAGGSFVVVLPALALTAFCSADLFLPGMVV